MSRVLDTYEQAAAFARHEARRLNHCMGIEKWRDYGIGPWKSRVFMLPNDPNKRFGFEARCETVNPGDPFSDRDLKILSDTGITPHIGETEIK